MTDPIPPPESSEIEGAGRTSRNRVPAPLLILVGAVLAMTTAVAFAVLRSHPDGDPGHQSAIPEEPQGNGESPKPGSRAPDINVPTLDGGTFSLTEHLAVDGRPVFINMWAEWCFPCREEMPAIDAISRQHPEVHFIGVVVRDREGPAREFVEDFGITYQIGLDADGRVEENYLVWVMPSTYVIGSDGVVIERFFGPMNESKLEELVQRAVGADAGASG